MCAYKLQPHISKPEYDCCKSSLNKDTRVDQDAFNLCSCGHVHKHTHSITRRKTNILDDIREHELTGRMFDYFHADTAVIVADLDSGHTILSF